MKVLVFTSLYPNNIWPNHGVFIKERMSRFANLDGCEVKVVAAVPYFPAVKVNWRWGFSQIARHEMRDGLDVYHPPYYMIPKVGMTLQGLLMFLSVLPTIMRLRKSFDFELIDAHYVYPDGFAAILLGRLLGKPVVVSARGSDISHYSNFRVIRRMLRYTLQKADAVISVCRALKTAMSQLGISEDKITIIPNGVDLGKFYRVPKTEARKKLGLPADQKIVLSVGGLTPVKGFDLLVKAVNTLMSRSDMSNLCLLVLGEGSCRRDLERLVSSIGRSKDIRFPGVIPHEQLYLWYSAADVFCLASSREGWPNVILEAIACGTPVVAADVWGIPEVIRSGEVGILTRRTEYGIAEGILVAFRKKWYAEDLLQYAKMHSWDSVALTVQQVLGSVLNANESVPRAAAACSSSRNVQSPRSQASEN